MKRWFALSAIGRDRPRIVMLESSRFESQS